MRTCKTTAAFTCRLVENGSGRSFSLGGCGFDGVPDIGYNNYQTVCTFPGYHSHRDCVEFVFCLRGECTYHTPEDIFSFTAGAVFVSAAGHPHFLEVYHKNLRLYWVRFRVRHLTSSFLGLPASESAWFVNRLAAMTTGVFKGGETLKDAFRRIFPLCEAARSRESEVRARLRIAILNLVLELLDAGGVRPVEPKSHAIDRIVERMRSEPGNAYPVRDIADEIGMSVGSLIAAFKRQTGYPPHTFLLSCRIAKAKSMLREGAKVSVVSDNLGFASQKCFSSYFRRAVGCSPRQWRADGNNLLERAGSKSGDVRPAHR